MNQIIIPYWSNQWCNACMLFYALLLGDFVGMRHVLSMTLTSLQWSYMVQDNWATLRYYWITYTYVKRSQILPFRPWKGTFWEIQANPSFGSSLECINGKYISKCVKKAKIWPFRFKKITFRASQPNISFDMWSMSSKKKIHAKKKVTEAYLRLPHPPPPPQSWRTADRQTDRQTDDGQLGIRKALLPFGWRS